MTYLIRIRKPNIILPQFRKLYLQGRRTVLPMLQGVLMILILAGCDNNQGRKNATPVSNELLDTIRVVADSAPIAPAILETAFSGGQMQAVNKKMISLVGINIGKLKLLSGKIIACDPLHIDEYGLPFTQAFPTGEFPVQLSIAALEGDERVAFGRITFSEAPVARWELAVQAGQKRLPVESEEIEGYAVDAGVVVFMDVETKKLLNKNGIENLNSELFAEMNKHNHNKWKYALYQFQDHNLAAFTTGLGDGRYATYIGFDTSGKPCRLVTDFQIFDWKGSNK